MNSRHGSLGLLFGFSSALGACGGGPSPSSSNATVPEFGGGYVPSSPSGSMDSASRDLAPPPASSPEVVQGTPPLVPAAPAPDGTSGNPADDEGGEEPPGPPAPAIPGTPVATHGQLHVDGTRLVDERGAPVQLVGVSTMWLNWEDRYSTSREALAWMRDNWGVTVIRAAMGVEPNGAYLTDPELMTERLRQVVENAIDVGVYVLVDWHDHNAHLHQEEAIAFFSRIAEDYGHLPNVIYEPFNEPLNLAWSTGIKPYHEAVLRAIRAQDPDNVAILGTRSWSQRVDEAARDRVEGVNLMYTVHFYACDHQDFQLRQAQAAYDAGLPLFVTEWGATPADGGSDEPVVCEAEAQVWLDWLDERSIGWAAWKLDGCRDSSCFFTNRTAPANGGWTDEWLNGHARFVVDRLRD